MLASASFYVKSVWLLHLRLPLETFDCSSVRLPSFYSLPIFASLPFKFPERKCFMGGGGSLRNTPPEATCSLPIFSACLISILEVWDLIDWFFLRWGFITLKWTEIGLPTAASQVLGLKVCTSTVCHEFKNLMVHSYKCSYCLPLGILHCDKDIWWL